ncbi:MAG: T9SS type A sorting domain-containing protein [Bacteroidia bacterium]|nr:T9SS type A sorting domain-containing protein [Bacteroidia bacterium]
MKKFILLSFLVILSIQSFSAIWRTYNTQNSGLPANEVIAVEFDTDGTLWIGTIYGGAAHFYPWLNLWVQYTDTNSLMPDKEVRAIAIANGGTKWFGTKKGLVKMVGDELTVYTKSNSLLPSNKVNIIRKDDNGFIWVGTNGGLVKINGDVWQTYTPVNSSLPDSIVTSIDFKDNNLWIGTFNKGLAKFSNNTWEVFNQSSGDFQSNQVFSLGFSGSTPLVRMAEGVYKYEGGAWDTLPGFFGLPNFYNRRIIEDNSGNLWFDKFYVSIDSVFNLDTLPDLDTVIFSNNYSLSQYNNGLFLNEFTFNNSGLLTNKVYSIFIDKGSNTLFIGTENGNLTLYNPAGITIGTEELSAVKEHVYPNPSNSIIHFAKNTETLTISDISGNVIFRGNDNTVDVSAFNNGIYLVQWTANGKVYSEKFVKN